MDYLLPALFAFVIVIVGILIYQNRQIRTIMENRSKDESFSILGQWISEMKDGIDKTNISLQQQLNMTQESLNSRLDANAQLMRLLNKDLGHIHEVGQQMRDFQHLFRSPKLRGNIGENILNDMLNQILPKENILLQHRFKNGNIVDALVLTENNSIAIDAKFPMENFIKAQNATDPKIQTDYKKEFFKDVKKHIKSVSLKYINPQENTVDFVLLYIPSESIYYEIVLHEQILAYAREQSVLLLSPNSMYYTLKIIMMGLEGQRIEETSARIMETLKALQKDAAVISDDLRLVNNHLNNAKNALDKTSSNFNIMAGKLGGFFN
jgi:DNA recombination protein RmuC